MIKYPLHFSQAAFARCHMQWCATLVDGKGKHEITFREAAPFDQPDCAVRVLPPRRERSPLLIEVHRSALLAGAFGDELEQAFVSEVVPGDICAQRV